MLGLIGTILTGFGTAVAIIHPSVGAQWAGERVVDTAAVLYRYSDYHNWYRYAGGIDFAVTLVVPLITP